MHVQLTNKVNKYNNVLNQRHTLLSYTTYYAVVVNN